MKRKPWSIVILSALHILAPLGNLWMNSFRSNRTLITTLSYWYYVLPKSLFISYVLLPPIAGIMIYLCRRWSYWVYVACLTGIFAGNIYGFSTDMNLLNLMVLLAILILDLLAVGYFVVPSVRTVYFDPKARWWETAPRFDFNLEAKLNEHNGLIRNVSVGGLFLEAWDGLQQGQEISVDWSYDNAHFKIPARIVYKNTHGYGVQFLHTAQTQKQIQMFIRMLQKKGVPVLRRGAGDEGFMDWLKNLITRGEGLFPKR